MKPNNYVYEQPAHMTDVCLEEMTNALWNCNSALLESNRYSFAYTAYCARWMLEFLRRQANELCSLVFGAYDLLDRLEPPVGARSYLCQICREHSCEERHKTGGEPEKTCGKFQLETRTETVWGEYSDVGVEGVVRRDLRKLMDRILENERENSAVDALDKS